MILAMFLGSAALGRQAAPPNVFRPRPAYALKARGNLGDTYVYETETSMSAPNGVDSFGLKARVTEVLGRKSGDSTDWDTKVSVHEVAGTGKYEPMAAQMRKVDGKAVTTVRNEQGRLLKTIVGGQEIETDGGGDVSFPKKVVEIGGTWQAPIGVAGKLVTIEYTLTKVFVFHGRKTASIEGYYLAGQGVKALEKSQFWVDIDTGRSVSSRIHVRVTIDGSDITLLSVNNLWSSNTGILAPDSKS